MKYSKVFVYCILILLFVIVGLISFYMGINVVNKKVFSSDCKITYNGNENDMFLNGISYKENLYADLASLPIGTIVQGLEDLKVLQSKNIIESAQTNVAEGVVLKINTKLEEKNVPLAFLVTIGQTNDSVSYMYKAGDLPLVSVYMLNKDNSKTKGTYSSIKKGDYVSIKETINLKTHALIKSEITIVPK